MTNRPVHPLRIVVAIATAGRPFMVGETLAELTRQSRRPDEILVCPATDKDFQPETLRLDGIPIRWTIGPRGLTKQRNQILDMVGDCDLIIFLDDDIFLSPDYLEQMEQLFVAQPDVVVATGALLADGILGPGIPPEEARAIIAAAGPRAQDQDISPYYAGYGCNMAFRWAAIRQTGSRFDERLPLYGWQEDVDFSRQVSKAGRVVKSKALRGVHLATKSGRQSGVRFGYSQVANPLYLWRKGTVTAHFAFRLMARNMLANFGKLLTPEPHVDRLGRVRGNLMALRDLMLGKLAPERVLELS